MKCPRTNAQSSFDLLIGPFQVYEANGFPVGKAFAKRVPVPLTKRRTSQEYVTLVGDPIPDSTVQRSEPRLTVLVRQGCAPLHLSDISKEDANCLHPRKSSSVA